jgi:hypothetical protein
MDPRNIDTFSCLQPLKAAPPLSLEDPIPTKTHLFSLTNHFTNLHIARDFSGLLAVEFFTQPFTNISPHRHVKAQTLEEYVVQYQEYLDICPEFNVKILGMSGEVKGKEAWVMVDAEQIVGRGVKMPCFSVFSWKVEKGRWKCWKIESLRGSDGVTSVA